MRGKRADISDYEVCLAYSNYKYNPADYAYEILGEKFKVSYKVAYAACKRACERDLVEYGVSLRTGWLTDKGLELLKAGVL